MKERIIFGINTVVKALQNNQANLIRIYLLHELGHKRLKRLEDELRHHSLAVEYIEAEEMISLTGSRNHQGAAAVLNAVDEMDQKTALEFLQNITDPIILVLDGIEDPRNYGACLRTAEAAGVDLVVSSRSRGASITPLVSKVASGALETQSIARVANLARFLKSIQRLNFNIIGLDEKGTVEIFESSLKGPLALLIGAEGKGLRRLTKENCDLLVKIPMMGRVESLNVSVAAGICLYEALRQR
ncbi:MAG: 23S rRNA (guanosine(2251)-2'-O)-methyltransferase RlmB [Pseudomonadota bacterium]|nr:23S rRNA (guanosine(2251)-2'-O)-methyltransferase RlmB [Pseudomonadota bacterium]